MYSCCCCSFFCLHIKKNLILKGTSFCPKKKKVYLLLKEILEMRKELLCVPKEQIDPLTVQLLTCFYRKRLRSS